MRTQPISYRLLLPAILTAVIGVDGCNSTPDTSDGSLSPQARRVAEMKPEPNIIEVGHFYSPFRHWRWTADQSRVRGTTISALYLYSNKQKGVFGDGIIRPRIYLLQRTERGGVEPKLIKEWEFDVDAAMLYRSKEPSIQGYGYSLPLDWGDLDLTGKEIRVIISFERRDGRIVESSKKDLIVPGQKGQATR